MSTFLLSTYLIPAILLNPVIILHGFNTLCSQFIHTAPPVSTSKHQWLENLGPAAAPGPYFDVHINDLLCWAYTFLMLSVQLLAYGKVNDTRARKKSERAAVKAERERKASQRNDKMASKTYSPMTINNHVSDSDQGLDIPLPSLIKDVMNGKLPLTHVDFALDNEVEIAHIEDGTTEPSSEEEIIV